MFNKLGAPAKFYAKQPFLYTIDDHDLGSNNADSRSPSSPEAKEAIRTSIKELKSQYYSFQINEPGLNIKFIVMDARFQKNLSQNYGPEQVAWLTSELQQADQDPSLNAVFIVHSWPWKSRREWMSTTDPAETARLK